MRNIQSLVVIVILFLNYASYSQGPDSLHHVNDIPEQKEVFEDSAGFERIFTIVEKMPSFPGGQRKMIEFIRQHFYYPDEALNNFIEGNVETTFVIATDGTLNDIQILKGIGYGCDSVCINLISEMPRWEPGQLGGRNVPVQMKLPFTFCLPDSIKNDWLMHIDSVLTHPDSMPEFPGGVMKMYHFLGENIEYPVNAKRKGIQGRVFITFVVEKDGSITNVKVLSGIGYGCDAEAIRVVKKMPKWRPGEHKGKPVRVQFNLPIKFTMYY